MADLFDNLPRKGQSGYSAKDIEGLEPVRRRPGMYIEKMRSGRVA